LIDIKSPNKERYPRGDRQPWDRGNALKCRNDLIPADLSFFLGYDVDFLLPESWQDPHDRGALEHCIIAHEVA
jgi:hypothetical protein